MSYSFYLWHYMVLTVTVRTLYTWYVPAFPSERLVVFMGLELFTVAAALALAQATYSWVEVPGIHLGQRLDAWARAAWARPLPAGLAASQVTPQGAD